MTDTMNDSDHRTEDRLRHAFAKGTVALRAATDAVTVIGIEGRPMTPAEFNTIRQHLLDAWFDLYGATLSVLAPELEDEERDEYHDHYSDGSPVLSLVQTAASTSRPEPREGFWYDGDLWWNPCVSFEVEGVSMRPGPTPAGVEVVVHETPSAKARAAYRAAQKLNRNSEK